MHKKEYLFGFVATPLPPYFFLILTYSVTVTADYCINLTIGHSSRRLFPSIPLELDLHVKIFYSCKNHMHMYEKEVLMIGRGKGGVGSSTFVSAPLIWLWTPKTAGCYSCNIRQPAEQIVTCELVTCRWIKQIDKWEKKMCLVPFYLCWPSI